MLKLTRRSFLESLGGGLLVLFTSSKEAAGQESGTHRRSHEDLPPEVSAWLHIALDNRITAFTGKVEVGQNIRTSLTQAVADELRCSPAVVTLVMGDTDLVPWDMGTFGSRSTPTMAPVMRKMAATAREALLSQASLEWNVEREHLRMEGAFVLNGAANHRASYGELAA